MLIEKDLKIGGLYEVSGIHFNVAIWTGETFRGPKNEYDSLFFIEESPYWVSLPMGTCQPIRLLSNQFLTPPYDGVNLLKTLDALSKCIWSR